MDVIRPTNRLPQHPRRRGRVAQPVDQDETAGVPGLVVRIERRGLIEAQGHFPDSIQRQRLRRHGLEGVHIDPVVQVGHLRRHGAGAELEEIVAVQRERRIVHPHQRRGHSVGDLRRGVRGGDHVPAACIHLVREGQHHRLAGDGEGQISVIGDDARDRRGAPRRADPHRVARLNMARGDEAGHAAELRIRPHGPLHRHAQGRLQGRLRQGDGFEIFNQGRAVVPVRRGASRRNIDPVRRADGDRLDLRKAERRCEGAVVGDDGVEHGPVKVDQIHLVHRQRDPANAHQGDKETVPPRLGQHALPRIDQDDGDLGGRGAGGHVAGVLLVARGVGDDELALVCREVAVGDIDGDALLPLGGEAVDQEREVETPGGGAAAQAVPLQPLQLILRRRAGVVEQPPDQGRLAVVHRAAGDEAEQVPLRGQSLAADLTFSVQTAVGHQK